MQRVKKDPCWEFAARETIKKDPRRRFTARATAKKPPFSSLAARANPKNAPFRPLAARANPKNAPFWPLAPPANNKKAPFFFTCSSCKPQKCSIPPPFKPCKPQKISLASFPAFSNNQKNQLTKTLHLRITRKIWWWRRFFWCAGFRCSQFFLASAPSKRAKCLPSYNALDAQPQTLIVERVEVFLQEKKNLIFHLLVGLVLQVMTPGLH